MSAKQTFARAEQLLRDKIPAGLDSILENAGFDSLNTIASITEEDIADIEKFTNENKNILGKTTYANQDSSTFKFKPGHKKFILNLSAAIKRKQKENQDPVRKQKNSVNIENVEIEEIELKQQLINKVLNFSIKHNTQIIFDADLDKTILEFHKESDKIKCKFVCPSCNTKFSCVYETYWKISNLEKHLKKHFEHLNPQQEQREAKETQSTPALTNITFRPITSNIVCHSDAQDTTLANILSEHFID